jgi:hypothetical protein
MPSASRKSSSTAAPKVLAACLKIVETPFEVQTANLSARVEMAWSFPHRRAGQLVGQFYLTNPPHRQRGGAWMDDVRPLVAPRHRHAKRRCALVCNLLDCVGRQARAAHA